MTAISALATALRDLRGVTITTDEDCARALLARLEAGGWRVVEADAEPAAWMASSPDGVLGLFGEVDVYLGSRADAEEAARGPREAGHRVDVVPLYRQPVEAKLTVGAALDDPRVQDGSHVAEGHDDGRPRQWGISDGDHVVRGWSSLQSKWTPWHLDVIDSDYAIPCRLVPATEADRAPIERGAL